MPPDSPPPKRQKLNNLLAKVVGRPSNSISAHQVQLEPSVTLNSSESIESKKKAVWSGLETALQGLRISSSSFPPLQSAVGTLTTCLEVFEQASSHREEYETLAAELEEIVNFLKQHLSVPKSSRIMSMVSSVSRAIENEVGKVSEIQSGGHTRRVVRASKDEETLVRLYRRVTQLFSRLQVEIGMDTWSIAHEHLANTRLESLNPAKQARYDSTLGADIGRRQCTEHTREATLAELYHWSDDPDAKPIYLMNGMAGTGKTTIACSLAKILDDSGRLGASFFCTRTSEMCRDANRIIPMIAYQLARYSTAFQSVLLMALDADPDLGSRNPTTQFERLLKEPLLTVVEKMPKHTVVVIDALDECHNLKAVKLILDQLARFTPGLPIKFFITARPEGIILSRTSQAKDFLHVHHLHEIEHNLVQHDIELYLQEELACIEPSKSQITQLAEQAGCLFIFAATAVRYIRPDEVAVHSTERLLTILNNKFKPNSKGLSSIDGLYSTVLASALENDQLETEEVERIRAVLWTAVCLREPATMETLTTLAGLEEVSQASIALAPLRSVLHVSDRTGLVCTLHTSFPDYLFHRQRSNRFFCDEAGQQSMLAQKCFTVMENQLRFNICDLESSYVFDHAVVDLKQRIESNISTLLAYACQHWANHLYPASVSLELCDALYKFVTRRLLFWMEVMNLQQRQVAGLRAFPNAQRWISESDAFYDLRIFINDTIIFVTQFFTAPVSLSTPHLYVSALPLSTGRVRDVYLKKFTGLAQHWNTRSIGHEKVNLQLSASRDSAIATAALSPEGTRVVIGSNNGTIELWQLNPRKLLAKSFIGRAKSILIVRFSPDGKYIASGIRDGSIWISEFSDGRLIHAYGPLEGHKEETWSLDFSPDGKWIASGSGDRSVCIWHISDGQVISGPCQGHSGAVRSVRFSPDGTKIASGSGDCSIRIWDAATGKLVLGPLEGHSDTVWSVDFSPDSKLLVSGSNDGTLCLWDITCGRLLYGQVEPQESKSSILSVMFSSGGGHVYCGTHDNSFRAWNVAGERLATASPQTGYGTCSVAEFPDGIRILSAHHGRIVQIHSARNEKGQDREDVGMAPTSWLDREPKAARVGFSADGGKIISASKAGRFTCEWDSTDGKLIKGPLLGSVNTTWSVLFPGGDTRVSTRSNNRAVHIWDKISGTIIAGPFQETSYVFHLRMFPDGKRTMSTNSTTLTLLTPDVTNESLEPFEPNPVRRQLEAGPGRTQSMRWGPEAHALSLWSVALSPDGTRVAFTGLGMHDYAINVWDITLDHSIVGPFKGHSSNVRSVAFSPDGSKVISGSDDRSIRIWDADLGIILGDPLEGHTDGVFSAVFSPDGKYVASGSGDFTIRVWNLVDRTSLICRKHADRVWVVDFSPSGSRVVSSSLDGTIIIWDAVNGSIIAGPFDDMDRLSIPMYCERPRLLDRYHHARPVPSSDHWLLRPNGWWTNREAELLFWVPHEQRTAFRKSYDNQTELINKINLGDRWRECCKDAYNPARK